MSEAIFKLGTLGDFIRGKGIAKSDLVEEGGLPCIRYAEIYTEYNEIIRNPISRVSEDAAKNAQMLEYGDIIFPTSGETAEEIGKASAFVGHEETYVGGDTIILRGHGQDPIYLAHALNSWELNRQKFRLATGNSVVHIYAQELSQLSSWLPNLKEQQKVVEILSDCDTAIEQAEQLSVYLAALWKKDSSDFLARLMKQERLVELSSIANISAGTSKSQYINENGKFTLLDMGGVGANGEIISKKRLDLAEDILDVADLVVPKDDIGGGKIIGKAAFVDMPDKFVLGDHVYRLKFGEQNARFVQLFLNSVFGNRQVMRVVTGSAQLGLSMRDFGKILIPLTNPYTQFHLASAYKQHQNQMVKIAGKISALKKQKRGLMQQLLTGKLHVKGAA